MIIVTLFYCCTF